MTSHINLPKNPSDSGPVWALVPPHMPAPEVIVVAPGPIGALFRSSPRGAVVVGLRDDSLFDAARGDHTDDEDDEAAESAAAVAVRASAGTDVRVRRGFRRGDVIAQLDDDVDARALSGAARAAAALHACSTVSSGAVERRAPNGQRVAGFASLRPQMATELLRFTS